jgi:hypothetical protein
VDYGCGYSVLVSLSRGRERVVGSLLSLVWGGIRGTDSVLVGVELGVVVSVPDVVDVGSPGLMSLVTGGLVLVTVSVVVVAPADCVREKELVPPGSR